VLIRVGRETRQEGEGGRKARTSPSTLEDGLGEGGEEVLCNVLWAAWRKIRMACSEREKKETCSLFLPEIKEEKS